MDYGQPVKFGVFLTPDASQPHRLLELSGLADELGFDLIGVQDHPYQRRFLDTRDTYVIGAIEDPEALRWFASDVIPAVREAVVQAR